MPAPQLFPKLVNDLEALIADVKQDELDEERQAQVKRLEQLLKSLKITARAVPNSKLKEEYGKDISSYYDQLYVLRQQLQDLYEKTFKVEEGSQEQKDVELEIDNHEAKIKEIENKNNVLKKLYKQDEILNALPTPHRIAYRLIPDEKRSDVLVNELIKIKKEIEFEFSGVVNAIASMFVKNTPEDDKLYAGINKIFSENKLENADENQFEQAASTYNQLFKRIEGVKNPPPLKKVLIREHDIVGKSQRRNPLEFGFVRDALPGEYASMPKAWITPEDRPVTYLNGLLKKVRKNLDPVETNESKDCVVDENCDAKSKPILPRARR